MILDCGFHGVILSLYDFLVFCLRAPHDHHNKIDSKTVFELQAGKQNRLCLGFRILCSLYVYGLRGKDFERLDMHAAGPSPGLY